MGGRPEVRKSPGYPGEFQGYIFQMSLLYGVLHVFHGAVYKTKIDDAECIQLPQYDYDSDYPLLQRFGSEYFTPYGIHISVRIRTKSTIIKK